MYQNAMSIASSNNIVLSYIPKLSHCSSQILDPNAPSSLASSIIIHHDDGKEGNGPPPVNSLELLQKRAQGILNNASQGLLSNNLADFTANKDNAEGKGGKGGEPFFKHRCRYSAIRLMDHRIMI